jgi:hypothetical protein
MVYGVAAAAGGSAALRLALRRGGCRLSAAGSLVYVARGGGVELGLSTFLESAQKAAKR